jgi:hypothetical protein
MIEQLDKLSEAELAILEKIGFGRGGSGTNPKRD